jgi:hypothetical protein
VRGVSGRPAGGASERVQREHLRHGAAAFSIVSLKQRPPELLHRNSGYRCDPPVPNLARKLWPEGRGQSHLVGGLLSVRRFSQYRRNPDWNRRRASEAFHVRAGQIGRVARIASAPPSLTPLSGAGQQLAPARPPLGDDTGTSEIASLCASRAYCPGDRTPICYQDRTRHEARGIRIIT